MGAKALTWAVVLLLDDVRKACIYMVVVMNVRLKEGSKKKVGLLLSFSHSPFVREGRHALEIKYLFTKL